jgi:hypothetical protein
MTKEEFLQRFPSAVEGGRLALHVLEDAFRSRDAEQLQCALVIGFVFGFVPDHVGVLSQLIDADWHYSHEDAVSALDHVRAAGAVEPLFRATQRIPKYLEFDEARALAVKAIWALGNLGSAEARTKLEILAQSGNAILRNVVKEQFERMDR